ncbi:hypothetical protein MMC34_000518 [Xylographa carneopallida]|nr:hypothetical protein [Xylographa carneopallida]
MADVYENAFFTIAAVSSPNSNMPFLVPRQREDQLHTIKIDCQAVIGQPGNINARLTSDAWSRESCYGPLSTRAWAWQERQLSVRIMQFTTTEVKWHCVTEDRCECTTTPPLPKGISWKDDPDTYNRWHHLVGVYTSRKMTYVSDKLPALSGVASRLQKNTQTEYLAGLWKENLKLDLLWARKDSAPLSRPLKARHQAPSWSWASIEGQVNYLFVDEVVTLILVKHASCSLATSNVFGEVNGGSVTIHALATRINLTATDPLDAHSYTLNHLQYSRPMYPDCILVEGVGQATDGLPLHTVLLTVGGIGQYKSPLPAQTVQRASSDERVQAEFGPINRLVWCTFGCVLKLSHGEYSVKLLILGESASSPDTFERLGLASIPGHRLQKWRAGAIMRHFTII